MDPFGRDREDSNGVRWHKSRRRRCSCAVQRTRESGSRIGDGGYGFGGGAGQKQLLYSPADRAIVENSNPPEGVGVNPELPLEEGGMNAI